MGRGGRRLLAAGALATIAGAVPAHASFPGANGPIVFASDRGGDFDIYALDAGSEPRNLTRAAGQDVTPAVSADGTRIAFQSNRAGAADVFVMGADGSGQRNLTTGGGDDLDPAFSPDGARVAWARGVDGNLEIHAMSAVDGSGKVNLTNSPFPDLDPAWSPDGSRIAFVRSVLDDFELLVAVAFWGFFVLRARSAAATARRP